MPSLAEILQDPDVAATRAGGNCMAAGPWTVRLPAAFGFCGGVLDALRTLAAHLSGPGAGQRVWLLGEIIHNDTVNDYFRARGVTVVPEADLPSVLERVAAGDAVVVPAFGCPRELMAPLRARAQAGTIQLIDTTCGYVQRIWRFVEERSAAGATVLIHGKPDHPEVQATLSRALTPATAVVLLPSPEAIRQCADAMRRRDFTAYPEAWIHGAGRIDGRAFALVAQTTLLYDEVEAGEQALAQAARDAGAGFASTATVCSATRQRQEAAQALCAAGCDLVLVIGGFASSNTTQLHRLARRHGPAYFIRNAAAFDAHTIRHFNPDTQAMCETSNWLPTGPACIGLLSGASCPASDTGGVLRRLRSLAMDG